MKIEKIEKINPRVVASTWQSIYKKSPAFFSQFDAIIVDETHLASAKSLQGILEKMPTCEYRLGTTGTLQDAKANKLVIEGCLGKAVNVITTKELMDKGIIAKLDIKCLSLQYSDEERKAAKLLDYKAEVKWSAAHPQRNKFLVNLMLTQKKNTLCLFNTITHGKALYKSVSEQVEDSRNVYLVYGKTDTEVREQIRKIAETETDAILICSYGTFSTGVSIKNIHSVIFAAGSKSKIRVLQSIGRGLRTSESKTDVILYDVVDDLCWKKRKNFGWKHFLVRLEEYVKQQFQYKIYKINLTAS